MKCPKRERLARYLDGELPERSRVTISRHLLSCPECRERLRSMEKEDSILRGYLPPRLQVGPACPDEETILAYAEGLTPGGSERKRISAHLAGCDYCAERVAAALEIIRWRDELEKEGLKPVPGHLARIAKKNSKAARSVSLGRVVAVLTDLRERFQRSFEYSLPAMDFAALREPAGIYETGRTRSEATRPVDGGKPRTRRVTVVARAAAGGKAEIRVLLTGANGAPLPGVDLRLLRETKAIMDRRTGSRGGAVFPGIRPGNYRLLFSRPERAFLDITILRD